MFTVKDKDGSTPTASSGSVAAKIFRCYTALVNWQSQTENSNIPAAVDQDVNPSKDLVTADTVMMVPCYADGADSSSTVTILSTDWTTGADNYIKIYTPVGTDEVGTSQRHNGVYSTSAYRFEPAPSVDYEPQLEVKVDCWIEGLQFSRPSGYKGVSVLLDTDGDAVTFSFSHNIVKAADQTNDTDDWGGLQMYDSGFSTVKVWNNIVYDYNIPATAYWQFGLNNTSADVTGYFYNNTAINCYVGITGYLDGIEVINNIAQDGVWGEAEELSSDRRVHLPSKMYHPAMQPPISRSR